MGDAESQVEELLRRGHSPVEISQIRGVPEDLTLRTLTSLVGKGRLRRSDIYYSIPTETRQIIDNTLKTFSGKGYKPSYIFLYLRKKKVDVKRIEVEIVLKYQDARIALGDLYQDIYIIEVGLHNFIRAILEKKYGDKEEGWWRMGIPMNIQKKCLTRKEEDEKPSKEAWYYTGLIDLKVIIDKNWSDFEDTLPKEASSDKSKFLSNLTRLNKIRNLVMHPVRGEIPTENDFEFIRDLKRQLSITRVPFEIMEALRSAELDKAIIEVDDHGDIQIKIARPFRIF